MSAAAHACQLSPGCTHGVPGPNRCFDPDRRGRDPTAYPERSTARRHDLRHSFVALALASGASLPEAAVLARHANAKVTATVYAGLADDGREKAASKLAEAGFGR